MSNSVYSKDIQYFLGIKKSYASQLISELEEDGFIYREVIGKWKRIYLTEEAKQLIQSSILELLSEKESQTIKLINF